MSLDLENLKAFVRVAEVLSFTRAAEHLSAPKARISQQVRSLESQLGCQLFQRTTRSVRITPDGEQLLSRAKALLGEIEDIEGLFSASNQVRGLVRLDLPVGIACATVIPHLRELLTAHPNLTLQLSTTDRIVDVVREGFDCVLRVGLLADSQLMAIRLGELETTNCASPSYIRANGKPRSLEDLAQHSLVHYSHALGSDAAEFEWNDNGKARSLRMRCSVTVNGTDALRAACLAGLGIVQFPRYGVAPLIESGQLVELLPKFRSMPLPVSLLHAHGRRVPRRVRVVLDWLLALLAPHLSSGARGLQLKSVLGIGPQI
jgi:DNA-binding transcriptional LysR family regulator